MTNITKEQDGYICPIADDCLFYKKPYFHTVTEVQFYKDYCLRGGSNCGLKRHHDISERIKRIEESKK